MANVDMIHAVPAAASCSITFRYDPPPSVAGKICKCWISGFVTNNNATDSILFKSSWTQINSVKVDTGATATDKAYITDPVGYSDLIGFVSNSNTAQEHSFAYTRIPDGPHDVTISVQAEAAFSANAVLNYRIHLEPMDGMNHYEKLVSNKTGPSIII